MNEAMQKLIDAVQKASPVVWQAAYRQVWIDFAECCLAVVVLLSVGLLFLRWARTWQDSDDRGFGRVIGWAISLFSLVPFTIAMECIFNPTFAAIKELKGLL